MQRKKSIIKKLIATMMVVMMMTLNMSPILTTKSYAASKTENLDEAVEVTAYFTEEGEKQSADRKYDTDTETLEANLEIAVKGKGYLRNVIVRLDNDYNFEINEENEAIIDENQIKLKDILSGESETVSIPVRFARKDIVSKDFTSKANKFFVSGTYISDEGEANIVEKEVSLNLSWAENSETKIETKLIKNIDYALEEKMGKILQAEIKVSRSEGNNNLPIKETQIAMGLPQIPGMELVDTRIDAERISFTQGREDYDADFENVGYEVTEDEIIITALNNQIDEKVYNSYGSDIFVVTFFYEGEQTEIEEITTTIRGAITSYTNEIEEIEQDEVYNAKDVISNIVKYTRDDKEISISKGYLIANSNNEKYEISYTKRDILNISRSSLISQMEIIDQDEYFVGSEENTYPVENGEEVISIYKSIEISKDNIIEILGEEGSIKILNMSDEVLLELKPDIEPNEEGKYIIEFTEPISRIKIITSKPVADGSLSILSTKAIKKINYEFDQIKDFKKLVNAAEAYATYEEGARETLDRIDTEIEMTQTKTSATLEISHKEFSSTASEEPINLQIKLNNNEDLSDLYGNPVFEIYMPNTVKNVKVKDSNIFYANDELSISNIEVIEKEGQKVIRIALDGKQTSYNINKESNGTIVALDLEITVDEFAGNIKDNIEMAYYNELSTEYTNQTEWNMLLEQAKEVNGYTSIEVGVRSPQELLTEQASETQEEEEEKDPIRVSSAKHGADNELLEENTEAKLATMYITIMNNSSQKFNQFKILGRVPFAGNKDIITGEDLGTTIDTILDKEITTDNTEFNYTVYYSENGEATEDLEDEANGWQTSFAKMGTVKSYLIIIEENYIVQPNTKVEFQYDYVIPANLQAGEGIFGTYVAKYQEVDNSQIINQSPDRIGYETRRISTLKTTINTEKTSLKELSTVEYDIKVENTSITNCENALVSFEVPGYMLPLNIAGNAVGEFEESKVKLTFPEIKAKETKEAKITFIIGRTDKQIETFKLNVETTGDYIEAENVETEEFTVEETKAEYIDDYPSEVIISELEYKNYYSIANKSGKTQTNVRITKKLEAPIKLVRTEVMRKEGTYEEYIDYEKNEITWIVKELEPEEKFVASYIYKIGKKGNNPVGEAFINSSYDLNDGSGKVEYVEKLTYFQPALEAQIINEKDSGYVKKGEEVNYEYYIKNSTKYGLFNIDLVAQISDNAQIQYIEVEVGDEKISVPGRKTTVPIGAMYVPAETDIKLKIHAVMNEDSDVGIKNNLQINVSDMINENLGTTTLVEDNKNGNKISGAVYVDSIRNQHYDENEIGMNGIVVNLFDSETNQLVGSSLTDLSGRYTFNNVENKTYYVKFNYNDSKYTLSKNIGSQENLNVLKNGNKYITDNIIVNDNNVSNINLGLSDEGIFDLKLDATIESMTVQNPAESNHFIPNNKKLSKVDIPPELVGSSKVFIEYKIEVTNQGTIPGAVSKIVDYLPKGMELDTSLNPEWYVGTDGNVYTRCLEKVELQPGETRELQLILVKNMTEENTGLVHNKIEIAEAVNERGILDIDSTPGNELDEDDLAYVDSIIGITTGITVGILPIIITAIIIIIPIAILVWRIIDKRRYV